MLHFTKSPGSRAGSATALAALLASSLSACSGASPGLPATSAAPYAHGSAALSEPAAQAKKSKKQLLFVGGFLDSESAVAVFDGLSNKKPLKPIRLITTGLDEPDGLTTDKNGNLYVANHGNNTVTEYSPRTYQPTVLPLSGLDGPTAVRVDGFGNIYVMNAASSGYNFIQEYAPGMSVPAYTWIQPGSATFTGMALYDPMVKGQTGALAAGYGSGSGYFGGIAACVPGSQDCSVIGGIDLGRTGGLAVVHSPRGSRPVDFLVADQSREAIDYFSDATLRNEIRVPATPGDVALDATERELFVIVSSSSEAGVLEYAYPAGKELNFFEAAGFTPVSVATYPSGTYH